MSAVSGGETRALAHGARPPLAVPRRLLRLRSDAALAERVAAGDEAAFDVLYERHRPVVLAVCMGILGAAHDAEDATQETFSALAVALSSNAPAELRPWLIRVARNASIDTTRRRKHRLLTLDGELPEVAARPGAGSAEMEVVLDGIRELPEQQRTALLMRELGGHTYVEIAEFMEIDEEAVRGLIARARVGLRSYREATELPCATARAAIETEPDGRRYDKTVRRHLRGCNSCRSYRGALRGDAKALRAALPLQTGGAIIGGGGLTAGAMSAAKASLLGAGMTQVAATCAASVCAVGAVGGMVIINPVQHLTRNEFQMASGAAAVVHTAKHHRHHHIAPVAPAQVTHHYTAPAVTVDDYFSKPKTVALAPVHVSKSRQLAAWSDTFTNRGIKATPIREFPSAPAWNPAGGTWVVAAGATSVQQPVTGGVLNQNTGTTAGQPGATTTPQGGAWSTQSPGSTPSTSTVGATPATSPAGTGSTPSYPSSGAGSSSPGSSGPSSSSPGATGTSTPSSGTSSTSTSTPSAGGSHSGWTTTTPGSPVTTSQPSDATSPTTTSTSPTTTSTSPTTTSTSPTTTSTSPTTTSTSPTTTTTPTHTGWGGATPPTTRTGSGWGDGTTQTTTTPTHTGWGGSTTTTASTQTTTAPTQTGWGADTTTTPTSPSSAWADTTTTTAPTSTTSDSGTGTTPTTGWGATPNGSAHTTGQHSGWGG
jgi:RNA polymerase sigma factor (sigma-70 family)